MRRSKPEPRCTVTLDAETRDALDLLARGRTRSATIRDAILRTAEIERALLPLIDRLDRIEARLANSSASLPTTAPERQIQRPADPTEGALLAWVDDDE